MLTVQKITPNAIPCLSVAVARPIHFPTIDIKNNTATVEHEASTSRISEEQLFYLQSRGLDMEQCISMIINGFCQEVFKELPLEFSVEAVKLLEMEIGKQYRITND